MPPSRRCDSQTPLQCACYLPQSLYLCLLCCVCGVQPPVTGAVFTIVMTISRCSRLQWLTSGELRAVMAFPPHQVSIPYSVQSSPLRRPSVRPAGRVTAAASGGGGGGSDWPGRRPSPSIVPSIDRPSPSPHLGPPPLLLPRNTLSAACPAVVDTDRGRTPRTRGSPESRTPCPVCAAVWARNCLLRKAITNSRCL